MWWADSLPTASSPQASMSHGVAGDGVDDLLDELNGLLSESESKAASKPSSTSMSSLPPERTLHLTQTLPYWHQGTVVLPGEHRAAANELLAGTVKVPYEEDYSGEA